MDGGQAVATRGSTDLESYDPGEGLKGVAVAEAAEKHFARAKDATKLYEAIEMKLGEQRRFVVWWDQQEKQAGARTPRGEGPATPQLEELGVDKETVYRWRKRLKDPQKFDVELEKASERCTKIAEFRQGGGESFPRSLNSGENEWYTPPECLKAARDVLGAIDLDPASSKKAQQHVRATKFFDKEADGLKQKWAGRVWLNPPYAQPLIAEFVSKMVGESREGNVSAAIMLTNNSTDTAWFQEAASVADAVCFTRGRIKFYGPKNESSAPLQGQAFFYFGDGIEAFATRFRDIGFVVTPYHGEVPDA